MRMTICKPDSSLTALRRDQPSQLLDFRFVASAQAHECLLSLLSVAVSGESLTPLSYASLPPNSLLYHRKFTSKLYFFHPKNLSSPLHLQLCKGLSSSNTKGKYLFVGVNKEGGSWEGHLSGREVRPWGQVGGRPSPLPPQ